MKFPKATGKPIRLGLFELGLVAAPRLAMLSCMTRGSRRANFADAAARLVRFRLVRLLLLRGFSFGRGNIGAIALDYIGRVLNGRQHIALRKLHPPIQLQSSRVSARDFQSGREISTA